MKINYLLTLFTILGIFASPSIATEFTMELLPKNKFEIQYSTCEVTTIDIKDNAFNEKIININNAFNKKKINSNNVFNKKTIDSKYNVFNKKTIDINIKDNVFEKKPIKNSYNAFNTKPIGNINLRHNIFNAKQLKCKSFDKKPVKNINFKYKSCNKKPIQTLYNTFNIKPIQNNNIKYNFFKENPVKQTTFIYYNTNKKSIDNIEDLPRRMQDITQQNIKIDGVYLDTENKAVWLNGFDVNDNVKLLTFINSNSNYKNRVDNNSEYHHIVLNYSDNTTNFRNYTIQCAGFDTIELNIPYVMQSNINPIIRSDNKMQVFLNGFKIQDANIVRKIA